MSIITIARGSYSRGKEVAERLAQKLGYRCISREILLEASNQFNIPEMRLVRALHDAPSVFERFAHGKNRYITYIRSTLLKYVQQDNVVYHGLAGHFFLQEVPHVLKVRIIADLEARVREEMKRMDISDQEARFILKKDDEERRKWGFYLYGADPWDTSLYDLLINTRSMEIEDAVDIIQHMVQRRVFQNTPESQRIIDNLSLSAQAEAALVMEFPSVRVVTDEACVHVTIEGPLSLRRHLASKVHGLLVGLVRRKEIQVSVVPISAPA